MPRQVPGNTWSAAPIQPVVEGVVPEQLYQVRFSLRIAPEQMEEYYRGAVDKVAAVAEDGRTIYFPARVLRSFVTHAGVVGSFVMRYDSRGRFHSMERVGAEKPLPPRDADTGPGWRA